jgi:hypothetical protein
MAEQEPTETTRQPPPPPPPYQPDRELIGEMERIQKPDKETRTR